MIVFALTLAQAASGTPPRLLTPGYGISSHDYPVAAWALKQEGRVVAVLQLDERGAITACEIAVTSGSVALDAGTCPVLLRRARFAPSRDAAGKPQISFFRTPINWQMPGAREEPIAPLTQVVIAEFDPEFVVQSCSVKTQGEAVALSAADCQRYVYLFPVGPLREASGGHTIRLIAERRQEYEGQPALPDVSLPGTSLARVTLKFRINANGRVSNCVVSDAARLSMVRGGSPCKTGQRFSVAEQPVARFPIHAIWTTSVHRLAP